YQIKELTSSFMFYYDEETKENVFRFVVPDWHHPNEKVGRFQVIDKTTELPLIREFPIKSMKQLLFLLTDQQKDNTTELILKIRQGLDANDEAIKIINGLRDEYLLLDDSKENIKLY